ncbi:MAG: cytochrome c peroxidase [Bacteroidota bacterium]
MQINVYFIRFARMTVFVLPFLVACQQPAPKFDFDQQKEMISASGWVDIGAHAFESEDLSPKKISCASCHSPDQHFQDGYELAIIHNKKLIRNTPSLLNVNRYDHFFWDGRATSLQQQLEGPLFARAEMDSSPEYLLEAIGQDSTLGHHFAQLQLSSPTHAADFIKYALEEYIHSITTKQTRFHLHQQGKARLTEAEQKGQEVFLEKAQCGRCHAPPHFTDKGFHDIGLLRRNTIFETYNHKGRNRYRLGPDYGRGNIVSGMENLFAFRTPSLINVTLTAPYMHDGRFEELEEVIDFYARTDSVLLEQPLSREEKQQLMLFLKTLQDVKYETPSITYQEFPPDQ